jgi:hypothetical protein
VSIATIRPLLPADAQRFQAAIFVAPVSVAAGFPSPAQDYYHGSVVVAVLDGELTIKRLQVSPAGVVLRAENPVYPDIPVQALSELSVWGVVTRCLHYV